MATCVINAEAVWLIEIDELVSDAAQGMDIAGFGSFCRRVGFDKLESEISDGATMDGGSIDVVSVRLTAPPRVKNASQSEVADERVAQVVDQYVSGFEVSVDNRPSVKILQSSSDATEQEESFGHANLMDVAGGIPVSTPRGYEASVKAPVGFYHTPDRQNIGMVETGRSFNFATHTPSDGMQFTHRIDDLDGDLILSTPPLVNA